MGVITEEVDISQHLQMPVGLPSHTRRVLSEITNFDRHAGDRTRPLLIAGGCGLVLLGLFAVANSKPDPIKPEPQTPKPAAPMILVEPPLPEIEEEKPKILASKTVSPLENGTLSITSDPRVAVYAGSRRLGRTPLEVALPPGTHDIRLVNKKRHLDTKRKILVSSNRTRKLDYNFGISKLVVTAPKGTKIYLNKRFVGRAPLKPIRVAEGRHLLKLVKGKRKHSERLDVPPSRTVEYNARF